MRSKLLTLIAAICIVPAAHASSESECKDRGTVSGNIVTTNASETLQYGITRLEILRKGKIYFSDTGVIVGRVVGRQDNGLPILAHTIYFSDGTRVETEGDRVKQFTPTGKFENGAPCEFYAVEQITNAEGSGRLKKLEDEGHNIEATGTVSFCSDNNRNKFELQGSVCFD